jgi:hypothetical protein
LNQIWIIAKQIVFTPNSVDVRATNLKTGQYQNYQMKFGKDSKATIALIKGGDYANQRLVVPTEQLNDDYVDDNNITTGFSDVKKVE